MTGSEGGTRPSRTEAAILLALLVLVSFWPVLSGRRTFFHHDLRYEHLPVWDVTQKALRAGESPFWIDGEFCGHPLLFHQEAPLFYPLTVPLLLTGAPVHRLADLFSLFHFWLAGFAAFLLLEDLDTGRIAALFGGVAWMLSARLLQSAIWPNAVAVSALLPMILLGIARIADGRRTSGILITAASGGLAILASRPQVLVGAAPLLLAGSAALLVRAGSRWKAAADLGTAALLALALGAPAFLPSAALYPEMSRTGGLSRVARDLYPISVGTGLDMVFLPVDGGSRWPEAAAYPGVLTGVLFLLGIGLALKRNRVLFERGIFLTILVGGFIGLAFAFGEAGPYRLFADLPILSGFRVPARFLTSWSLAVALGSALVLSRLLRQVSRPILVGGIAVLLCAGDLAFHALRAAPTSTAALDSIEPALVRTLRSQLGRDEAGFPRRYWPLTTQFSLTSYPDGVREAFARRYDALNGALGMRFGLESVGGAGPALLRTALLLTKPTSQCAMLAGAGLIVGSAGPPAGQAVPPEWEVRPVPSLPRAILVPRAIAVSEDRTTGGLEPDFDPRQVAIVERTQGLEPEQGERDAGSVRLLFRRPGRVELETSASSDQVLVLFDAWEKGWGARIDGERTEVFPADIAFRGVRVPAGRHRVLFEYHAPAVKEGLATGLLGLTLLVLRARRNRKG